MYENKSLNTS